MTTADVSLMLTSSTIIGIHMAMILMLIYGIDMYFVVIIYGIEVGGLYFNVFVF